MAIDPFNPSNVTVLAGMIGSGLACTAYGTLAWRRRLERVEQARHWSAVDGEILSAEVVHHPSSDDDEYGARVRYAYQAGGRRLIGDRLRIGPKLQSTDETLVRAAIAPYRPGTRARVRYDPTKPERAVLEAVPNFDDLRGWLLFGIFLLGSSAFVAVTLSFASPF